MGRIPTKRGLAMLVTLFVFGITLCKVSSEELNVTRPTRVEDALKGKVSGVQITQSSGQPGSDSKVRIRGIGTINDSEQLAAAGAGIDWQDGRGV